MISKRKNKAELNSFKELIKKSRERPLTKSEQSKLTKLQEYFANLTESLPHQDETSHVHRVELDEINRQRYDVGKQQQIAFDKFYESKKGPGDCSDLEAARRRYENEIERLDSLYKKFGEGLNLDQHKAIDIAKKFARENGYVTMSEAKKILRTSKWKTFLRNTGIGVGTILAAFAIITVGNVLKHRNAVKYAYDEKHISDPNVEKEEYPSSYHGEGLII